MPNVDDIIDDAIEKLAKHQQLRNPVITHIMDRYFSKIYEIKGEEKGRHESYVLKVSTTHRSCENEYKQYIYLNEKKIKSLVPVYYSTEYNYLITVKEDLIEFDNYLRKNKNHEFRKNCFSELGKLFKKINEKTGEYNKFNKSQFDDYVLPRIEKLDVLSKNKKTRVVNFTEQLTSNLNHISTRTCFVSDFSLGNIHVNKNGEFVLLDMGDAYHGDIHDNFAYIYLNMKFGALSNYFERNKNMILFKEFVKNCEFDAIDKNLFLLFQIKHLINMIDFINGLESNHKIAIRRLLSTSSNKYLLMKYKNYLFKLIKQ